MTNNETFAFLPFTNLSHAHFDLVRHKGELITACVMLHFFKHMNRTFKLYKNGSSYIKTMQRTCSGSTET